MALNYGIKVSKVGFDVFSCADKDLIFSSKLNQFKVAGLGSTATHVAHGLAYNPVFFASTQATSTKFGIIGCFFGGVPYVDGTYLESGGSTVKYYYFYHQST